MKELYEMYYEDLLNLVKKMEKKKKQWKYD